MLFEILYFSLLPCKFLFELFVQGLLSFLPDHQLSLKIFLDPDHIGQVALKQ